MSTAAASSHIRSRPAPRDMSDLISNVLDLTRLEVQPRRCCGATGRRSTTWSALRSSEAASGCATTVSSFRCRRTSRPCTSTPRLIVQLFANLLENAAKYTPPGTRVVISARSDEHMLEIIVEDDGPGLPGGRSGSPVQQVPARPLRERGHRCWPRSRDLPRHRAGARRRHPRREPRWWWGAV